jgi:hypothetical protein
MIFLTNSLLPTHKTLLNVTADHFRLMSHQSQVQLLNSVIGNSILCSLSVCVTLNIQRYQCLLTPCILY